MTFRADFTAELWRWRGDAAWHFLSLPEDVADEIEERMGGAARGFGSVPVRVTIGSSTWGTSVFPSKQDATYVLPVKRTVREAEGLTAGSAAEVTLTIDVDRL